MKDFDLDRVKRIFIQKFPNGNVLEVTKYGFILWDDHDGRWTVDASCLCDNNRFSVAQTQYKIKRPVLEFNSKYKYSWKKKK